MKRMDHISHLQKLSLGDLQRDVLEIEKKIQAQRMAIAFGKSKEVSTIRQLKKQLARGLTIANQKLAAATTPSQGENHE